jgi:uncharacterized protein (DUF58 family)
MRKCSTWNTGVLAGQAVTAPAIVLTRRNIYILPTRHGLLYGLLLAAVLLGAINYNNSLAHLLAFLLASVGFVAMISTHRNLSGLAISRGEASRVHAGGRAGFPVSVHNPAAHPRYSVMLQLAPDAHVHVDLSPGDTVWETLLVEAPVRGLLQPGPVLVSTRFPMGLFRAWSRLDAQLSCIVYPRPAPPLPFPATLQHADEKLVGLEADGDFSGLRAYRAGDPVGRIHWKALARSEALLLKEFGSGKTQEIWLDETGLPPLDTEQRLSQLCRWVLDAEAAAIPYGLRLGSTIIPPNLGGPHRARCLEALALF